MRFVLNGRATELTQEQVVRALKGVPPEEVRQHGVRVVGTLYPVMQAFEVASGVPRADFTSQTARRHLSALGLPVVGTTANRSGTSSTATSTLLTPAPPESEAPPKNAQVWPWEGAVQALFVAFLEGMGWQITATADTATKAQGVDVLAEKDERRLGAEVKGWPSRDYADHRRAHEIKRTQPTTQAPVWFSQALLKAVMLLDSHPGFESLMVLPDFSRYRDLAKRTATGRAAASVHVAFVAQTGDVEGSTWNA